MEQKNLYDFDKTIIKKDSFSSFYFFMLKKRIWLCWHFFVVLFWGIMYVLRISKIERLKESMLFPLRFFKEKQKLLNQFADVAKNWCFDYYKNQMSPFDVVCSASPTFLVKAIMQQINPKAVVLGSEMILETQKFEKGSKNCKGQQKVLVLKNFFKNQTQNFENAFSDSLSDVPILCLAKNAFLVKNGKPLPFDVSTKQLKMN